MFNVIEVCTTYFTKKDTLFKSTVRLKWLSKIERYRRLRRKKSPETLIKQTLPGSKRKL